MRRQRRGTIIVAVLVSLLVVSTLAIQVTRSTIQRQRQVRMTQNQLQSLWTAESAVGRAVSRLRNDPQYSGETWQIPAEQITGEKSATVEIKVESVEDGSMQRRIIVEAFYPSDSADRIGTQKTVSIQLRNEGDTR